MKAAQRLPRRRNTCPSSPNSPGAGQTVENLTRIGFRAIALVFGQFLQRLLIGDRTPQEGRNVIFLNLLQTRGNAGLAEILLRQNVGRDLGELRGNVDIGQTEHDGSVRVLDFAHRLAEFDLRIGGLAGLRKTTFDAHLNPSPC